MKKRMTFFCVVLGLFLGHSCLSQVYFPVAYQNRWLYLMPPDQSFEDMIIPVKKTFSGESYNVIVRKYSWGQIDTSYVKGGVDGAVYFFDVESNSSSLEVPADPQISYEWDSPSNSWHYEIVDINATFETPEMTFRDCVVIRSDQINVADSTKYPSYLVYYSRGIGFVGSKVGTEIVSYLATWKLN
jgi:hypothetical protein